MSANPEVTKPDLLGDRAANAGGHTPRHNAVLRAVLQAAAAVSDVKIIECDRDAKDAYQHYNVGHVPDLAHPGGSPWGTDALTEIKVPSPLTITHHAGRGNNDGDATAADVGNYYAFGSTEEPLRYMTLGARQRGHVDGPKFDATTGRGYVARKVGHYDDAITKTNQVVVAVVESLGGISPPLHRQVKFQARRAGKKNARDGTRYSRVRPVAYLTHHTRMISASAVLTCAANTEANFNALKISLAAGAA